MNTKFITFEAFHGRPPVGSSRIRAHWPIAKWEEAGPDIGPASLFKFGDNPDVVIYQKVYWWEHAENFKGIKILDICDPDFLHYGYPIKKMINAVDAITCSSEKLAFAIADFAGGKPVWVIDDHVIDPDSQPKKNHRGPLEAVSWFGWGSNFPVLDQAVPALVKRKLKFIVVSETAYIPKRDVEVVNYPHSPETWIADFMRADVVINPKIGRGRFAYKSDNKTYQAWACGMPVAKTEEDLDRLADPEARQKEGDEKRQWVIENRDVRKHVEQLKALILEITAGRKI